MKLLEGSNRWPGREKRSRHARRHGSALVIVLILLSLMAALMVSNAVTLRRLKVELQRVEQKHKQRIDQLSEGAKPKPAPHRPAPPSQ